MPSDVNQPGSPIEHFISETIAPQRDQMHQWTNTKKHQGILLEDAAKRRRITPTKLGPSFVLVHAGHPIGGIDGRTTTLVSGIAREATQTSQMSHSYLRASQVPIKDGRTFHVSQIDAAESYRKQVGPRVTARPSAARAKPVTSLAVSSPEGLRREWERSSAALSQLKGVNQLLHVESYNPQLPLRIYVVGERAVAAVVQVPFHLIGDGSSSVLQLVEEERSRRNQCEYLSSRSISPEDELLAHMGLTLDEVIPADTIRVLDAAPEGEVGGGFSVDVFDDLSEDLKHMAIDAMWAFPGLTGTAVDIMAPALDGAEGATVSNVVPTADISEFLYPAYGEPRRCGVRIIDQMINGR